MTLEGFILAKNGTIGSAVIVTLVLHDLIAGV